MKREKAIATFFCIAALMPFCPATLANFSSEYDDFRAKTLPFP
jgi:hypothetical protein